MRLKSVAAPALLIALFGCTSPTPHVPSAGCTSTVSTVGALQGALSSDPAAATICVAPGTYTLQGVLRPSSGQTISGYASSPPTLDCASYCFDGLSSGADYVTLRYLYLEDASKDDIRTGNHWLIDHLRANGAAFNGVNVQGTGTVIRSSTLDHNGEFGLKANKATSVQVLDSTIADNPSNPSFGRGYSGGLKSNQTVGMVVIGNTLIGNGGGGALWFDINSRGFEIVGNTVSSSQLEGIRVEISCQGLVQGNSVSGSGGPAIDVFNSHGITVNGNTIDVPSSGSYGLRMMGNGRTVGHGGTGGAQCSSNGAFGNVDNVAEFNTITFPSGGLNGVVRTAGITQGNSFTANRYVTPDCSAAGWKWWSGSSETSASFSDWQALGQDATGTCSSSLSGTG